MDLLIGVINSAGRLPFISSKLAFGGTKGVNASEYLIIQFLECLNSPRKADMSTEESHRQKRRRFSGERSEPAKDFDREQGTYPPCQQLCNLV